MVIVVWAALLSWLLELSVLTAKARWLGQLRLLHPESSLLGALLTLSAFTATGILLVLLQRLWPGRVRVPTVLVVLSTLAFAHTTLEFVGWLHAVPALLFAAGLGTATARIMDRRRELLVAIVRRTTLPLVAVVAVWSVGPLLAEWTGERRALARLPQAETEAPNVLLIILDTVRAISMGLYNAEAVPTPNLDQFALRGAVFSRATATAPWTLPSHASMFTGRYVCELTTDWGKPFVDPDSTLAEVLSKRGFVTAGFVGNLHYASRPLGLARGFVHYEDFPLTLGQAVLSTSLGRAVTNGRLFRRVTRFQDTLNRKDAQQVIGDFLDWADEQQRSGRNNPFFAFLNLFDAHEPYLPPEPYRTRFARPGPAYASWYDTNRAERYRMSGLSAEEIAPQLGAYEGSIASLDARLGELFEALEARGMLDNTIVIVTSDHGEEFGEHGVMGHSRSIYLPLLHVPLVMAWPDRLAPGTVVDQPVTLRDLPATVVDLLGLNASSPIPGVSWTSLLAGTGQLPAESALLSENSSFSRNRTIMEGRYHYLTFRSHGESQERLYDAVDDPLEQNDLSQNTAFADTLQSLRGQMDDVTGRVCKR